MFATLCLLVFSSRGANADTDPPRDVIHLATVNSVYRVALEKIAERYEKAHPEVEIKISIIVNDFSTWLRTQFAGGENLAPDIYNGNYTADYIGLGRWEPLNAYLESNNPYTGTPWQDCIDYRMTQRFAYSGNLYFIPLDYLDVGFVYNQDIFRQLGLEPPETWSELIDVCETIQAKGRTVTVNGETGQDIIPMAVPGNAKGFWEGAVGWFTRILTDAYHRSEVELLMAQPGDWCYNPDRNAVFNDDFSDPYNDIYITLNYERQLNAFLNGTITLDSEKMRHVYSRVRDLTRFWARGYQGFHGGISDQLFFQQKAAIVFTTTHFVTLAERTFRRMAPEERFEWDSFGIPRIDDDPLCESPTLRGICNAGANLVVTRKSDREHVRRAIDFLMFLTTPESGQTLLDETLADDQFLAGPITIRGVKMPKRLQDKYAPFMDRGFEKLGFRPYLMELEWVQLTQEFLAGYMSVDQYVQEYQALMMKTVQKEIRRFQYDLDPTTRDDVKVVSQDKQRKNILNPIENGILTVFIIVIILSILMIWGIMRARGIHRRETTLAFALLIPTFCLLAIFNAYPVVAAFYRSFTLWEEGRRAAFNGLENFSRLFTDYFLRCGLVNMLILTLANLVKATLVPFLVAELLMMLSSPRLRYFFRNLFLVPVVVPGITMILIWGLIYDPNIGVINSVFRLFGHPGYCWLGEHSLALLSIIFFGFPWVGVLGLLVYMAGLLQIDASVHETARIDCPNIFQRILFIDVPLVRAQTKFLIIVTLIGSIQDFQTILLLTNGGPGLATSVPALQMYHWAFKVGEFGYASAVGFLLFLMILTLTLMNLRFIRGEELS